MKDIKKLRNHLKDKGYYNLNRGPQPQRGEFNSISNNLSLLDKQYRDNLYYHHNYHLLNTRNSCKHNLDKSKFYFNNVDMNLGNVKWYSTLKYIKRNILYNPVYKITE